MVYGLLAGSLLGAIVGVRGGQAQIVSCRTAQGSSLCASSGGPQVVSHPGGAVLGGVLGIAVGGIGGRFVHTERWIDRPLGVRRLLTITPAPGCAMTLGVSMHF